MHMNARITLSENRIDFLDILRLMIRKIHWLLLMGILCGGILWSIASFFVASQYGSRITMYVYNNPELMNQNSITNADLQASQNLAKTYIEILQSNRVLDSVVDALPEDIHLSRGEIKRMLSVSTVNGTQLLRLTITSTDPNLSYMIANVFAEVTPDEIKRVTKVGNAEIVDYAELSNTPVLPNKTRYAVSGFFGGVLIAALFFLIRAWTDYTLYFSEDVEKASGLIVLGEIPEMVPAKRESAHYRELTLGGYIVNEKKKEKDKESGE